MSNSSIDVNRVAACITDKHLGLILMPTEKCNFRCTYCYEDFLIGKMNADVISGVKSLIGKRLPELHSLNIEWFGGEPLAAKNVIYDIGEYVNNELLKYPKVHYLSGMTTNGFNLTPNTLRKLLKLRVKAFQISLDGPREEHNKTRLRINGEGSFDKIWNNLLRMRELKDDFDVTLRVHVTPENYKKLEELIFQINENFGNDSRFKVFLKAIENLGGENGGTFKTLAGSEKGEILKHLYSLVKKDQARSLIENKSEPYICYASKPNNLVIRADGRIAKCTVVFSDHRNDLGRINSNGTISVDADKLNLWVRGLKSLNLNTLHCPLHGLPSLPDDKKIIPIMAVNQ